MSPHRTLIVFPLVALSLAVGSCGGGSGGSTPPAGSHEGASAGRESHSAEKGGSSGAGRASPSLRAPGKGGAGEGSPGPRAKRFETRGADNSIQRFGNEGSGSELLQAAAVLHSYLRARAAGRWSKACSYMRSTLKRSLDRLGAAGRSAHGGRTPGCARILAGLSTSLPASAKRSLVQARIGALRVEGRTAFLLFHGAHHMDYAMPMAREHGHWKVSAIAASPLP